MSNKAYPVLSAESLSRVLATTSPHSFKFNIARMHDIYRMPKNDTPTLDPALIGQNPLSRLDGFRNTLADEISEYDLRDPKKPEKLSIRESVEAFQAMSLSTHTAEEIEEARQDVLTDLADWFGDIIVYCRSEAMKFGLPLEDALDAIMGSNFTKLASDGIPVYDANGKFQKDMTNFVPPEPSIKSLLFYHKKNADGQIEASSD